MSKSHKIAILGTGFISDFIHLLFIHKELWIEFIQFIRDLLKRENIFKEKYLKELSRYLSTNNELF